eukprot:EG_transcript_31333
MSSSAAASFGRLPSPATSCGTSSGRRPPCLWRRRLTKPGSIYEFRQYQLRLGYDTVPSFLKFYSAGLPSKLRADLRATLVTVLHSDLGVLNTVIEVWRHNSVQAMMDSQVASRGAQEWRSAIASIASLANSFHNTIFHPRPESRWK